MLSAGNQTPTSVRYYGSDRNESADAYLSFFLERYTTAYRHELDHFLTAIEDGTPPSPSFADGRAALALADAANQSLRTGKAVKVG
jgi:myo-inositol 2-dehydrogenase/D-chiro-inositol 1-dehydrogenase